MHPAEETVRLRPWLLGLVLLVHLLLGYLILTPSAAPGLQPYRGESPISGSSALLAPGEDGAPAKPARTYHFSFDRTPLVGPSTLPPPGKGTRTVAPPFHPS